MVHISGKIGPERSAKDLAKI
ncbi:MAG: hypothetical protein RIR95_344, partial [Pseudomonadota bacterium]